MSETAPYGSWTSPIVPALLTGAVPGYAWPRVDRGNLYWLESRPWENGRSVIVQKDPKGNVRDVLKAPLSARSRVHEYGGAPYLVADDMLYFCLQDDQRLYAQDLSMLDAIPRPLTPESDYRFADFCLDRKRQRLICVAENHAQPGEPENLLVSVPLDRSMAIQRLCEGADFYAYPRLDKHNEQLCWVSWDHPDLPWDNTQLWLTELDTNGNPGAPRLLAGSGHESIVQPCWSPDNQLCFISDRDNWWNLYRWDPGSDQISALLPMKAEFATPLWVLGMSNYGFCDNGTLVCSYTKQGSWQLATLPPGSQTLQPVSTDYTQISDLYCEDNRAWLVGASATREGYSTRPAQRIDREHFTHHSTGLSVQPPIGQLSNQRGKYRPRILLPTGQPRIQWSSKQPAAAHRRLPWRSNRGNRFRPQPENPVLDQPGLCRTGCELPGQHWLWTSIPATTPWPMGHRRCG